VQILELKMAPETQGTRQEAMDSSMQIIGVLSPQSR